MNSLTRPVLVGLLATIALAPSAGAQSPVPDDVPPPLTEATRFAPSGTSSILFTDWAAVKAAHGYEDLTSQAPMDERIHALLELGTLEAPFAGYGISRLATHAESWGWDTTDLEWESSDVTEGAPVSVLRLREGFDLAPVVAHFDERGFTTEVYDDAIIRSHPMDASADWISDSDFGILNTAFLDDGRTLVLSSSLDALMAALDARHVEAVRASPAWVVAEALGTPLSAAIDVGPDACTSYDPHAGPVGSDVNDGLLAQVGPLHAWEAMGIGTFRDDAGAATGRYLFEYGAPDAPIADEAGRARLADEGISQRAERPYAEVVFRLVTFGADAHAVTLEVPVDGQSRRLQQAYFGRDMVFATCG